MNSNDNVLGALDELGLRCRQFYRIGGLRAASMCMLEGLSAFFPLERINMVHVPYDLSGVVSIMDTQTFTSKATTVRQPGSRPPLLFADRLGDDLVCGDLEPYKTNEIMDDPHLRGLPFVNYRSMARFPLFHGDHAEFIINFWSHQPCAFASEDVELLRRATAPLAEELLDHFLPLAPRSIPSSPGRSCFERLQGCPSLGALCKKISKVAAGTGPVLILGETGVGKEFVARAVHELSSRHGGNFVAVNCGAIPESLLESELFGYVKGAFTGAAANSVGYFEQARGGTLFLDEIGEMSLSAQIRLLRVLENGSINRLGSPRDVPVDVRVVAATHADLPQKMEEGSFRKDLWYRLSVFPLEVPPLRTRKEDVGALAKYFLRKHALAMALPGNGPELSGEEFNRLYAYDWPGNVRELEHVIERSLMLREEGEPFRLDFGMAFAGRVVPASQARRLSLHEDWPTLRELEARYIREAITRTGGKLLGAGSATELLGIHYSTLRKKMLELGIPLPRGARKKE